jgi:hypothetical protein
MNLNTIGNRTTWNEASSRLNQNFEKLDLAIVRLEEATIKNKGYFKNEQSLKNAIPNGEVGDRAYVGYNAPYAIYQWDETQNTWITDGTLGGDDDVNLGDYYTKEETKTLIDEYHEVLTQEQYEAIIEKEDKFYFTYEEE